MVNFNDTKIISKHFDLNELQKVSVYHRLKSFLKKLFNGKEQL